MKKTNLTAHARFDRMTRIEYIIDTVGIGEVIAECASHNENGGYRRLTSTGVIIVVGNDKRTIITAFIAEPKQAAAIYLEAKKVRKMPDNLYNRVRKNEYYQKNQPRD